MTENDLSMESGGSEQSDTTYKDRILAFNNSSLCKEPNCRSVPFFMCKHVALAQHCAVLFSLLFQHQQWCRSIRSCDTVIFNKTALYHPHLPTSCIQSWKRKTSMQWRSWAAPPECPQSKSESANSSARSWAPPWTQTRPWLEAALCRYSSPVIDHHLYMTHMHTYIMMS